jgi:hypothetical protein
MLDHHGCRGFVVFNGPYAVEPGHRIGASVSDGAGSDRGDVAGSSSESFLYSVCVLVYIQRLRAQNTGHREIIKLPSRGAEREEITQWAILAKEPDCRGDLWWAGGEFYYPAVPIAIRIAD